MLDAGYPSEPRLDAGPNAQPRAQGAVRVAVRLAGGRTRLARLYQQGSARCLLPRLPDRTEAVLLNTAGGITGGDRLDYTAEAEAGARLTVTTQAAERIYRAQPGSVGRLTTRLTLGPRACIHWLPQETILFDHGALERRLEVDMASDATLLALEPLILGRARMGERVERGHLTDQWRIRRDGRLVYADALRLTGAVADIAARPGVFGANRAAASLVYVAPDAEDRLAEARALLPVLAGASAWDGLLAVRMLAADGAALRTALIRFLSAFIGGVPRVWTL
jgi:urease accessory protein